MTSERMVSLTVQDAFVKSGAFRTVFGRVLTQEILKSLDYLVAFQADDEGSIPFTRSSLRSRNK
jgi:hypothetical protein